MSTTLKKVKKDTLNTQYTLITFHVYSYWCQNKIGQYNTLNFRVRDGICQMFKPLFMISKLLLHLVKDNIQWTLFGARFMSTKLYKGHYWTLRTLEHKIYSKSSMSFKTIFLFRDGQGFVQMANVNAHFYLQQIVNTNTRCSLGRLYKPPIMQCYVWRLYSNRAQLYCSYATVYLPSKQLLLISHSL